MTPCTGKTAEEVNREGHEGLAWRRIVGGAKGGRKGETKGNSLAKIEPVSSRHNRDTDETNARILETQIHPNAMMIGCLLTCGQCGHKFVILDSTRYGCSGWKYRGLSVCSNTTMAPRKLVEELLLDAIQRDLFTEEGQALFIQETTKLLAAQRRGQQPDHQKATQRLREVEQEIDHLMTAIKAGILTQSTKAALERAEAEHVTLLKTVQGQYTQQAKVTAFLPNAIGRFKTLLDDLSTVTQLQVDRARGLLRVLLGHAITLHPCSDGQGRYLTAEVTGDYAGLLRLSTGQNKFGGGQPIKPSLAALLRFEIQGVALAA